MDDFKRELSYENQGFYRIPTKFSHFPTFFSNLSIDFAARSSVHHVHQMDGLGVVEAACGDNHTVLLTYSGRTFSFGSDSLGQCGFGKKLVPIG